MTQAGSRVHLHISASCPAEDEAQITWAPCFAFLKRLVTRERPCQTSSALNCKLSLREDRPPATLFTRAVLTAADTRYVSSHTHTQSGDSPPRRGAVIPQTYAHGFSLYSPSLSRADSAGRMGHSWCSVLCWKTRPCSRRIKSAS